MPVVEIAAGILGSELIKTCWQGAVGNYVHGGCEWLRGKIPQGTPENHDVLKAMHACFRQSIRIMADACAAIDGTNADSRLDRRRLGDYARSTALAKLALDAPDIPDDLLEAQIREIYGMQSTDAREAAAEQVILFVEGKIGCRLTPALRGVFQSGSGDVESWAANFELLFAAEIKRNEKVRSILIFSRTNELVALSNAAAARIEALFDRLDRIDEEIKKGFDEQHGRHDSTQDLIRAGHRLQAGDLVDRVEAAIDIDALHPAQRQRLLALSERIAAQTGGATRETQAAAQTAFRLEQSNEPAQRAVAELVESGELLAAARLRARAAEASLADETLRAAEALRDAATLAAPVSPATARDYYERAAKLDPTHVWGWIELGRLRSRYEEPLSQVRACFDAALNLATDEATRSALHTEYGDLLLIEGKLADARREHEAAFAIDQPRAEAEPNSKWRQRDLSVSYNKLGVVEVAAGNLTTARQRFEAGLAIRERLAALEPGNSEWQRDLSVSYDRLGDVEVAAGNLTAARQRFEAGLAIAERLAALEPGNSQWQRDLSISYERLGDVEVAAGNFTAARQRFEAVLAICERLAALEPGNSQWQRDVFIGNAKLALLLEREGDVEGAIARFEAAAVVVARLVERWPDHPGFAKDLEQVRADIFRLRGA